MMKLRNRQDLERLNKKLQEEWDPNRRRVYVCMGTGCKACGGDEVLEAFRQSLRKTNQLPNVDVIMTGCHGFCENGTLVMIQPDGTLYTRVTSQDVPNIIKKTILQGKVVKSKLYVLPSGHKEHKGITISREEEIPFYKHQMRVVLGLNGKINPTRIEDYVREGGYLALAKVLFDMKPIDVIEEVIRSGLRGRGGGGFPTGQKWRFCQSVPGEQKYVICNADEGDPGAFMDRSLLEGNPHAVLEGMCIGAWAIGASQGYIYVRAEYPLAIQRLKLALDQMREAGFLGDGILGSDFSFEIHIKEGAGAFVCGEETALIASIEGKRGMPNYRPPFPANKGLFGKPTNINNVETWGNVPLIIAKGADWFAGLGTEKSKGTKIFSLVGKVNNTGLVEVPMGMKLRELVDKIGGGVKGGGKLKAVQTGGPSGGCLPVRLTELPIDYDHLAKAGSIMGSGGLVVMDENTCMVDLARYFLSFTQNESCGKCAPCRVGTREMLTILERICAGEGRKEQLDLLQDLGTAVQRASLCGLGQTAPNPLLTTLRFFREEYEEHILDHHCRAAVCKGLVKAPCHHTCPAGVEAHRYVRAVSLGKFDQAYLIVRERMPLPSVCGLVCFHPCEDRCRRGSLDEPIAIRALKGAAVKYGGNAEPKKVNRAPSSGKKVAVVGSGPAGLTAAYYLSKLGGHDVTVFEALPKLGGMLRVGIPRYRLPEKDLERDVRIVRNAGVKFKTNSKIESITQLKRQGFDAVFLSMGAHRSLALGVKGERVKGVVDCVAYLRDVSLGKAMSVGPRVVVVGGGNSAIDAVRSALRTKGKEVTVLYRRSREEMPADEQEIKDALEEGAKIETLTLPIGIRKNRSGLVVTCQRMQLGEIDASGRRRPVPIPESELEAEYDTVISAIGQQPDLPKRLNLEVNRRNQITVTKDKLETSEPGVFAGGDVVTGPASVVEAIAHGRKAAESIDRYLGGSGIIEERMAQPENLENLPPLPTESRARYRPSMPHRDGKTRIRNFCQVEIGYSKEAAVADAKRCLRCDLED